jgi:hypothetical protein
MVTARFIASYVNPAFAGLMDEKRYKAVVKRLKGVGEKY